MAGNKKKKKPAANSARGFATTSIQSKSKVDLEKDNESTEASQLATPDVAQTPASVQDSKFGHASVLPKREMHGLSPDELEAQLEETELQQIVEKQAPKVRKEISRQVTRLKTDRRLLRGQSDFLSVKKWLPDELMQLILDYVAPYPEAEQSTSRQNVISSGDDLIGKVWTIRDILLDFVPDGRVSQVIDYILMTVPQDRSAGQVWGLDEALEWLAYHCEGSELLEYDVEIVKKQSIEQDDSSSDSDEASAKPRSKHDSPVSNHDADDLGSGRADAEAEMDVSDLESDLEPDELLTAYIRTKARLFEIDSSNDISVSVRKKVNPEKNKKTSSQSKSTSIKKLHAKLEAIQRDALFDTRQAEAQWASRRIELARDAAERRKLGLPDDTKGAEVDADGVNGNASASIMQQAESEGILAAQADDQSDGEDMVGGMFEALPGVAEAMPGSEANAGGSGQITVHNFGKLTGVSPRRVLEETCRSRDSRCKITYRQVSPTTYACRHAVTIQWSKPQGIITLSYLGFISIKSKSRTTTITMVEEAAPDATQSEAYVATAALFVIFSGSPKEEKAHLRLPPAFRTLWDRFALLKQDYGDAQDRETVRQLRDIIDSHKSAEDDDDDEDEVVFKVNNKRLTNAASGTSTPISRPQTPNGRVAEVSQQLQELWTRKVSTPAYQRMLLARMNLPMFIAKTTAMDMIEQHQITIVVGDTGSGKSTQLPQFLLEHELSQGRQCKIYCTEPRRISALSLAQRVSEELGESKGDAGTPRSLVGYAIRLESHVAAQTRLVFATVGIVLRMLENADGLKDITHLVLDEVHERSIDTDFLLIIIKSLRYHRPDLKVILMSATVDAEKFSRYLDNAPIISVPGRTFPVQARFLEDAIQLTGHTNENGPVKEAPEDHGSQSDREDGKTDAQKLKGYDSKTIATLKSYDEYSIDYSLMVKLLEQIAYNPEYQNFSKAVLIFLPGIGEIRQLTDIVLGHPSFSQGWRIHALHSTFSSEDQQAAFEIPPPGIRKIVIATNIAETGITIPDITCVIDTGKHREMRFDERRQMSRLTQSFVARANAKQRRGRAGRVQEGICFHLFTRHRFEDLMAEQQSPEMLRLSLQDLVMRVKICNLGNIEQALAEALDPPLSKNVRRAIDALIEVGALTESEQLTPLGSQLAKLPLDAQLGKLILYGSAFGCLDFALTVAAALTSKSPFLSPMHAKKQADSVRMGFKKGDSDLLTLYNAYCAWRKVCTTSGVSERNFCNKNFLSPQNLANIEDLKAQLLTALADSGFVELGPEEKSALSRVRPGSRYRNFVALPEKYTAADTDDDLASSVVAWSFYPKIVRADGKGWRNISNNASLGLHPMSVNKHNISPDIKYLSFYSIMQNSARWTNAQETSPVSDFALVLLAGDAVFHTYAGVIIVDGNRLRFKVKDWKTMIAIKILRSKVREALGRMFKHPGRDLGIKQKRWLDLVLQIFKQRAAST